MRVFEHLLKKSINGCQMEIDDDLNDDQKKALVQKWLFLVCYYIILWTWGPIIYIIERRSLSRHKLRLSINGCQMEIDDDLNDDQKKALQKWLFLVCYYIILYFGHGAKAFLSLQQYHLQTITILICR